MCKENGRVEDKRKVYVSKSCFSDLRMSTKGRCRKSKSKSELRSVSLFAVAVGGDNWVEIKMTIVPVVSGGDHVLGAHPGPAPCHNIITSLRRQGDTRLETLAR